MKPCGQPQIKRVITLTYVGKSPKLKQVTPTELVLPQATVVLAASNNDLVIPDNTHIRFTLTIDSTITGLVAPATARANDGRQIIFTNTSATQTLTIANQSTLSIANNRINTGTDDDIVIAPGATSILMRDSVVNRWNVVGGTGSGGTGSGKNYLAKYFSASASVGTVGTLASTTSDISADLKAFYSDGTSTIALNSSNPLRDKSDYLLTLTTPSGTGRAGDKFIQFPAFSLNRTDYSAFEDLLIQVDSRVIFSGGVGVYLVRYNQTGIYQGIQTVISEYSNTSPVIGLSDFPPTSTGHLTSINNLNNQLTRNAFKWRASVVQPSDLFALRFANYASATTCNIDALHVGPLVEKDEYSISSDNYYDDVTQGRVKATLPVHPVISANGNLLTAYQNYTMQELCQTSTGATNFNQISVTGAEKTRYIYGVSGGASLAGNAFIQFPVRAFKTYDLNKPVCVSIDTALGGPGQFDVVAVRYNSVGVWQETIPVYGNSFSASTSTPSSVLLIAGGSGVHRNHLFYLQSPLAIETDVYALRIRRLSGTDDLNFWGPSMGFKSLGTSAVITDWAPVTLNIQGFGASPAQQIGMMRRDGSDMLVHGRFQPTNAPTASPAIITIPEARSLDTSLWQQLSHCGSWIRNVGGLNEAKQGRLMIGPGNTTSVLFSLDEFGVAASPYAPRNGSATANINEVISFDFRIPIAGWSSNTFSANNALTEYAWNSDTTNTDTLTSGFQDGSGNDGALFGSYLTTTRTKRVRFKQAISPVDTVFLRVTNIITNKFIELSASPFQSLTTTTGMSWDYVAGSTTDIDVRFGANGYSGNLASGGSANWSGIAGNAQYKWHLVKKSPGGEVLLPIGARNVVGDTTGTAVPQGFPGERIIVGFTGIVINTATYVTLAQISLPPGNWDLGSNLGVNGVVGGTFANAVISTIPNSGVGATENGQATSIVISGGAAQTNVIANNRKDISIPTTFYLNCIAGGANNNATGTFIATRRS